jgi:uncharacterized damage-inducible protein DinB
MPNREIILPPGYDAQSQRVVGSLVAQLDLQLELLKKSTRDLMIAELEWQPHSGLNTIGMLLAHIAVAECHWLSVVARDIKIGPEGEAVLYEILGLHMDDDGLPLAADGHHPVALAGKTVTDYCGYLDRARESTYAVTRPWSDADLEITHRPGKNLISRHWILYHALEHFAGHRGQIQALRHMLQIHLPRAS